MKNTIKKAQKIWIIVLSIAIPIVVALLFMIKLKDFGFDVAPLHFLPPIYAVINGITAMLLIAAVVAIKNQKIKLHKCLMTSAIACSLLFLAMYVAYHATSEATMFGDINHDGKLDMLEKSTVGKIRFVYYFILFTHILLSIIIIPMVLTTYLRAWASQFDKHKKIAKITFPLWLYIAITGVIIYLMIAPYYQNTLL